METINSHIDKCDRCGSLVPDPPGYKTREFTLAFSTGSDYPTGGQKAGWQVHDLCDDCVTFLRELLIANEFKITQTESDW